jgi:3-methyladenine DNA glycosylase AlkD
MASEGINRMTVLNELQRMAEENYKAFNTKIIPTKQTILGVRLPILRKVAKRIAKEEPIAFIGSDKQNIYELIMLEGMVLSYMDKSFTELLPFTEAFLDKVDNWAQIDSTVCDFKNIGGEKKDVLAVVKKWLKSDREFIVRAGLVILLAHYVEKDDLMMIFDLSQRVEHTGYYVHMGNAWLISVCMAKFPEETMVFFKSNTLDDKTHNKGIQKSSESFRVSKEHKAIINHLKRR